MSDGRKLVYRNDPEAQDRYELFDLATDLGEAHNLAAA